MSNRYPIALLLIAIFASGCGGSSGNRKAVFGNVTAAGNAAPSGTISFYPAAGTKGPAATTEITSGKFAFTNESGPLGGAYKVVIDLVSAENANASPPPGIDIKAQGISGANPGAAPPAATQAKHLETEWTVPESGSLKKDFHVE